MWGEPSFVKIDVGPKDPATHSPLPRILVQHVFSGRATVFYLLDRSPLAAGEDGKRRPQIQTEPNMSKATIRASASRNGKCRELVIDAFVYGYVASFFDAWDTPSNLRYLAYFDMHVKILRRSLQTPKRKGWQ